MSGRLANRRIRLLLAVFAIVFGATLARAVWLQGVRAQSLGRMAASQHRQTVTVAANQLHGQNRPIETLGSEWLLVCRSDLSEDLVYQLTREFFAQLPALARDHGEAALIDPEQAPAAPIPLHAGAARYYREREILR